MSFLNNLAENVGTGLAHIRWNLTEHSPEILLFGGVTAITGGTVMACRATLKTRDRVMLAKAHVTEMKKEVKDEKEAKNLEGKIFFRAGLQIASDFAPGVLLSLAGIACVCSSNYILQQRNAALAAAYAILDKGYREYRARVADRFGDETEKEIRYSLRSERVEGEMEDENGKKKKVKGSVQVSGMNESTTYARFFKEGCSGFERNGHYNLMFLKGQQELANLKLRTQRYLLLNEVYEMLGMKPTKAGAVVGWLYDEKNPTGDNYVDFGIYNLGKEELARIQDSVDQQILLDFNVDGYILDGAVSRKLMEA